MFPVNLGAYTEETGLFGRVLNASTGDPCYPAFGVWLGHEHAAEERPAVPCFTACESLKGSLRRKFMDCILEPYGVAGMRVDDPWQTVHRLDLHELYPRTTTPFLHRHGGRKRIVCISSILADLGSVPTAYMDLQQYFRSVVECTADTSEIAPEWLAEVSKLKNFLQQLECTTSQAIQEEINQYIHLLWRMLALPQQNENNRNVGRAVRARARQHGYVHTWGSDELVVCDDQNVVHGPSKEGHSGHSFRSADISYP